MTRRSEAKGRLALCCRSGVVWRAGKERPMTPGKRIYVLIIVCQVITFLAAVWFVDYRQRMLVTTNALQLVDDRGRSRGTVFFTGGDRMSLDMIDANGVMRMSLAVDGNGQPSIMLRQPEKLPAFLPLPMPPDPNEPENPGK